MQVQVIQYNYLIYIYCDMIVTVSLVNIHQLIYKKNRKRKKFSLVLRTLRIYSYTLYVLYRNVNYSHQIPHYILVLNYNWNSLPFDYLLLSFNFVQNKY